MVFGFTCKWAGRIVSRVTASNCIDCNDEFPACFQLLAVPFASSDLTQKKYVPGCTLILSSNSGPSRVSIRARPISF